MRLEEVKIEDRKENGQLKDEVRERIKDEIEKYILYYQQLNISEISRQLKMKWSNVKDIVEEILKNWDEENKVQKTVQSKWYRSLLQEFEEHPENFEDLRKMKLISFKDFVLRRINELEGKNSTMGLIEEGADILFFKLFGKLSAKTIKMAEEKNNVIEQPIQNIIETIKEPEKNEDVQT